MICRMCKSNRLYRFLDLGPMPPADQFLLESQLTEPEISYPLEVYLCDDCGLVQLGYVVAPEILYQNDYPYESSTTEAGRVHWQAFAKEVVKRCELTENALVVDIGSNVGVLLKAFSEHGMRVVGVDPAPNIVKIANDAGIETICDFFGARSVHEILSSKGPAHLITTTNVFAHVDDLHTLMHAIGSLLSEHGVFIFEVPYFPELVKDLEYDTIYHEHLSYFSVKPLVPFFASLGMQIFDIQRVDIHGGSIRVFVEKGKHRPVSDRIARLLCYEEELRIHDHEVLDKFAEAVYHHRTELVSMLTSLKKNGKRIVAVSAPAKGMTLLNFCKIDGKTLEFVTEKSNLKIGKYTPKSHIPLKPDSELLTARPDYALVLAWNFASEIIQNLSEFRKQGGKFIVPIPRPTIIE